MGSKAAAKGGFNDDLRDRPSNRPLSKNRGSQDQNKHFATRQDPSARSGAPNFHLTIHSQSPTCSKCRVLQTTLTDLSDRSHEARCTIDEANPPIKYRLRGEKEASEALSVMRNRCITGPPVLWEMRHTCGWRLQC